MEREDLLADYRALSQQIKLKNLAIAAFIPPAYQDFIMARCSWNEYKEQWVIAGVQAAGEQTAIPMGATFPGVTYSSTSSSNHLAAVYAVDLCLHWPRKLHG